MVDFIYLIVLATLSLHGREKKAGWKTKLIPSLIVVGTPDGKISH